jgi:hypothetical protein
MLSLTFKLNSYISKHGWCPNTPCHTPSWRLAGYYVDVDECLAEIDSADPGCGGVVMYLVFKRCDFSTLRAHDAWTSQEVRCFQAHRQGLVMNLARRRKEG